MPTNDIIVCKALQYECILGFHRQEKNVPQKISIDLEASVLPPRKSEQDQIESIRFDYYIANQLIKEFLEGRKFNLVETVAHEIAGLLLDRFKVASIKVTVVKYPLDMLNASSISYTCVKKSC